MSAAPKSTRTKRQAGHLARNLGDLCEQMTANRLRRMGYLCQRIATPTRSVRGKLVYTAKVLGDFVGCDANGRAVLVECKTHADGRRPVPSDFRPHQVKALRDWNKAGAVVLVAWLDANRSLQLRPAAEVLPIIQ